MKIVYEIPESKRMQVTFHISKKVKLNFYEHYIYICGGVKCIYEFGWMRVRQITRIQILVIKMETMPLT